MFEWATGSDALDEGSRFTAEIFPSRSLRWQGAPGVQFDIQHTTDLRDWQPLATCPGEPGEMEFALPPGAGARAIYRVTPRDG